MLYLAKYEEQQVYGGPEEGGWYYDHQTPEWKYGIPLPESLLYRVARYLNDREDERRKKENRYGYTSVLSHHDTFYTYTSSDFFKLRQTERPHYE